MKHLTRRLREAQRDRRIPAISAQVRRGAEILWSDAVHAEAGDQFRIGSITKTFTAALVLQCRDEGLLDLDDRLSEHLPVDTGNGVTLRRLLCHRAGVQREPFGDLWAGGQSPDVAALLGGLAGTEQVLAPGRRFHYSNLGIALLGEVVAGRRGAPWAQVLADRLLTPLGLTRTSLAPQLPHAQASYVRPYTDVADPEPHTDMRAVGPAAQLWATADDLSRWGQFLAAPDPAVLAPASLAEMAEVAVMSDALRWTVAYGLGLMLYRRGDRILVGHGGAMPGFLAGLVVDRDTATSAVVLAATGAGADAELLACQLLEDALTAEPGRVQPWTPAGPPPADVLPLLGRWWTEGNEVVLSWHGRLEARLVAAPAWRPPAVFERELDDGCSERELDDGRSERWRTVSGREVGELLLVTRAADGTVARLSWATYALTRTPESFADLNAAAGGPEHA